jgi:hypothetical protein
MSSVRLRIRLDALPVRCSFSQDTPAPFSCFNQGMIKLCQLQPRRGRPTQRNLLPLQLLLRLGEGKGRFTAALAMLHGANLIDLFVSKARIYSPFRS